MRCFVAAWPDDGTRAQLARVQDELAAAAPGARPMQPRNFHLTLAFIGEFGDDAARALLPGLATLRDAAPSWSMDTLGWFHRARVAWVGGQASEALADIAARSRALLDACGVSYDRKPFVPHVTLYRNVREFSGARSLKPLAWRTERVALYAAMHDRDGPVYREVDGEVDVR